MTSRLNKTDYVSYLRERLIPDLLESGSIATATDFEAAARFIEGDKLVNIPDNDHDVVKFCNYWRTKR